MADDSEIQNTPESPLGADPDQPLTEDLSSVQEIAPKKEAPPEKEKEPAPAAADKFAFFKKQPIYIKVIASCLVLFALIWYVFPRHPNATVDKKFLIALNSDWHPLQLMTKERDMTTFCKVLFEIIAMNQNLRIRLMETGFDLFPLLDSGEVDGVISILPPSELSSREYISSDPIYRLGVVLIVKKSSNLTSSKKINDGHIGIVGNAQILAQVRHLSSSIFINYENPSRALADLDNGTIDGVIMDTLQAGSYLRGLYAGRFKILPPPLISEGIELYLRKNSDSEHFLTLFNEGLQNLRASGAYQTLISQWGLINTDIEGIPAQ